MQVTGRIIRNLPSSLGRRISLVVFGDAIQVLAVLVSGMVLARVLAQDSMGTYRQVQYLTLLITTVIEFGLSSSIYRFWPELDEETRARYVKMLCLLAVLVGGVSGALLAVLGQQIARAFESPELGSALAIGAWYVVSAVPLMFLRPIMICNGSALRATLLETGLSVSPILALLIPAACGLSLNDALFVWVTVCVARMVVIPLVLRRYLFTVGDWWDSVLLFRIFAFVWPIQASRVPGIVMAYIDKVIMSLFLTPAGFAVYSMGAREIPFVGGIGPSVSSVLLPELVEDLREGRLNQICRRWRKACVKTAMLSYPLAAFCVVYSVPVVEFMFSSKYRESSVPFAIFSAITFVRVVEYASLAKVFERTRLILASAIFSAVASTTLAVVLAYLFGVIGMASAVLLGTLSGAAYLILSYRALLRAPVLAFFPLDQLVALAGIAFAAALFARRSLSRMLPTATDGSMFSLGWALFGHLSLAVAAYLVMLMAIGRLLPELRPIDLQKVSETGRHRKVDG